MGNVQIRISTICLMELNECVVHKLVCILDIETEMYFETDFPCEICAKWCRTEAALTYHIKKH